MATREDPIEFKCLVRTLISILNSATDNVRTGGPTLFANEVCDAAITALFEYAIDDEKVIAAWNHFTDETL